MLEEIIKAEDCSRKLVITIPEEVYKNIQSRSTEIQAEGYTVENAVLNGTPIRMTGKWNTDQRNDWNVTQIDNRDAERIDVTDEYYHEKYDTISCPHCGCTLSSFAVMPFHFCYMCGGQFGERKIAYKEESEDKNG